ncbi:hypothetical protein GE061_019100 [Apolygus lucorum]|uniref:SCP domain-containing protein n=1 Tax=Apolygus lucorum TaxID=248454 RepID=A0A8S9XBK9_APOLU|nr:hypothetical protein GE061_019100 [Apolygus lucorum]
MVWATTWTFGCGDAIDVKTRNNKTITSYQITCLLGPASNKVGAPMFKPGEACSNCPSKTACGPYGLLCTRSNIRDMILDKNRTSRCIRKRDSDTSYDDERQAQAQGRFRDFNTGQKVVLKPRNICDPISSFGTKITNQFKIITAVFRRKNHELQHRYQPHPKMCKKGLDIVVTLSFYTKVGLTSYKRRLLAGMIKMNFCEGVGSVKT